jgi:hypothetical protein
LKVSGQIAQLIIVLNRKKNPYKVLLITRLLNYVQYDLDYAIASSIIGITQALDDVQTFFLLSGWKEGRGGIQHRPTVCAHDEC